MAFLVGAVFAAGAAALGAALLRPKAMTEVEARDEVQLAETARMWAVELCPPQVGCERFRVGVGDDGARTRTSTI